MSRNRGWGFPRWEGYEKSRDATSLHMCEYPGCTEVGEHPCPKARDSQEKWWFCQTHAADYNRSWNYFDGMSDHEREHAMSDARYYTMRNKAWDWAAQDEDAGRAWTPQERAALSVLGLHPTAMPEEIKQQYRRLAKENHPDANLGDPDSETRFKEIQAAYDVLRAVTGD